VRRRVVTSTAIIALASVLVLGIPLGLVESARVWSDANSRLEREADSVAGAIDDRLEAKRPLVPAQLARFVRPEHRVLITPAGGVPVTVGPPLRGEVNRVRSGSSHGATVIAEAPASEVNDRVLHAWLLIAALAAGGVAAAVGLALVQARRLARPLESLARTSAQLGGGDFSTRAGRFSIPEVDALARVFDATAERIAHLVGREREFSANVSHQLRTPLTALRLRLDELGLQASTPEEREEIEAALRETDRLESTISDLLAYARRARAGDAIDIDVAELTRHHAATWRTLFRRAGRDLVVRTAGPVALHASPGALGQVLDVLLDNALQHGRGRARIVVSKEPTRALVCVEDEGPGVESDAAERIFDRGSSEAGRTGIGLHIAQVLARAEGGDLRLAHSSPPRFELTVPLPREPRTPGEAVPATDSDGSAQPPPAPVQVQPPLAAPTPTPQPPVATSLADP
jgi:signal transduction histidine kinase